MPSFFYHLAFELTTTHLKLPAAELHWEPFQITLQGHPQHRSSRNSPTKPATRLATIPGLEKSAQGGALSAQSRNDQASISKSCEKIVLQDPTTSSTTDDWRWGKIFTQGVRMAHVRDGSRPDAQVPNGKVGSGVGPGPGGLATKGRFEPTSSEEEELGWGIVRLYRDGEETPGLYDIPLHGKGLKIHKAQQRKDDEEIPAFKDEECTTLCILAVPSYLTPSDFLGFVGEQTREEVSHFRMIRTEKSNRYMVLMKFRNGRRAREWRKEWNGKAFDSMEPENCHVVFVKSIAFLTPSTNSLNTSFPDMTNDPFTPSTNPASSHQVQSSTNTRTTKPLAPPTPSLIELPTCPVCLERMDESTGLLTILCQHVFHCSCLQKWRGSGCPVCRYTQKPPHPSSSHASNLGASSTESRLNECSICHSDQNLWICLICGNVGCGRYDAAHAFSHYTESSHAFSMDMQTQRVWDYASDGYVHRLVQDAHDGKFVDLSSAAHAQPSLDYQTGNGDIGGDQAGDDDYDDFVPRSKLQTAGLEYTHLLTSQLDSQRMYFEGILERAADKASLASQSAEKAQLAAEESQAQLEDLQEKYDTLSGTTVPELQKDNERISRKAEKFEQMARKLEREWREEKTVSTSLMTRIEHLQKQVSGLEEAKEGLVGEKRELEEMVRDLMFTVSGSQKVAELGEEVEGGSVSLPDRKEGGGGRRKNKGKK